MASSRDADTYSRTHTPPINQTSRYAPPRSASSVARHGARPDHKAVSRLGQFRIERTIGEGSFGKVKLAIHEVTGQKVALKFVSQKDLITKDMAGRVEREIQYLQLLRHPHIIKLYNVITTPTDIIMVIEFAGGELFDYLVQYGKMTEDSARRFFQQIISAVEYCHRHKIVHRDLKPENLLLDESLNVKIADFGLSNIMTDGNFLKTSCGSPNYAAPEVINGKLYAGPEVDVWSCGVILFVLLCGTLPFDDEYIPNLFKKIAKGFYTLPSFLSPDAKDLISRMLIVNPMQRITIEEIRKHPWFKKNLPEYLQPPKEEFFDTGVDVTKLPPLKDIDRGPVEKLKSGLHEAVVDELGSKMGYKKADVQAALTKDEPSAIKDAYMIVRENQMMIPKLSTAKNDGFIAQSPPAWNSNLSGPVSPLVKGHESPMLSGLPQRTASPLTLASQGSPAVSGLGITSAEEATINPSPLASQSPASSISILASSMPAYHKAFMDGSPASLAPNPQPRQQPLQRQSRTAYLQGATTNHPSSHAVAGRGRVKATRWQFGIRSRNPPYQAIGCIYRALKKLGAEWTEPESDDEYPTRSDGSGSDSDHEDNDESPIYSDNDDDGYSQHSHNSHQRRRRSNSLTRTRSRRVKIPKDPWVIHARWKKFAPITVPNPSDPTPSPTSTTFAAATNAAVNAANTAAEPTNPDPKDCVYVHLTIQLYQVEHENYLVDFKCAGYERLADPTLSTSKSSTPSHSHPASRVASRQNSAVATPIAGSDGTRTPEVLAAGKQEKRKKKVGFHTALGGEAEEGEMLRIDDTQQQGKKPEVRDGEEKRKEVNSPFPFLDAAGRLIIALAEAGE
ncbi:Pkinase-domain-containing protein [Ascodesmis nigricans]|uniref:non-specific serine/threonine protein kinase n=1 Tax=Ascodesmis nigricans TaxID=341454 RepID=A0A4S2N8K4_9PEZI|nr:Pkinase-domain-containing protein [Ascodesmis nigricans]